jgi:multiple sugar transport system substrate-binding protein
MPTRQSLRDGWLAQYPNLEPMLNGADYARKWQFRPGFSDVLDTINAGLQEAFTGTKTPQAVLSETQSVGEQVLAR